ncbi:MULTISPECIES: hypothetical protein [Leptolyngbya]|uniref:hypothetical protein n=1 Tax=Leptolyngbya TaxID=47251 RepID=UPI001685E0F5|nr:hypothetical protein [Leptolyngbya sp. FACHB-1624]MBD1857713.1 hypothetical protein [Leptolyngbya sp. FACHB-1624]
MKPDLSYYSQPLADALAPTFGDRLEQLFYIEKVQLIGAIGMWISFRIDGEIDDASFGDYVEEFTPINPSFDAWDVATIHTNFRTPDDAMPLLKALVAQLDQGIWMEQEP